MYIRKLLRMNEEKNIVSNRKARYEYEIVDKIETGLVLVGSEVKSLRAGRVNIADAYARVIKGEMWVTGMHISSYKEATYQNHDPLRDRKLLLHQSEIKKLTRKVEEKGFTLIPLRLYFKKNIVKMELGVARGKRQYDKKVTIAERDAKRDLDREEKKLKYKI